MFNRKGQVSFGDVLLVVLLVGMAVLFGLNYAQFKQINIMKDDVAFKTKQISDLIDFRQNWKEEKKSLFSTTCYGFGNNPNCSASIELVNLKDVMGQIGAANERANDLQKSINNIDNKIDLLAKTEGLAYQTATTVDKPAEFRKRTKDDDAPTLSWGSISSSTITASSWR